MVALTAAELLAASDAARANARVLRARSMRGRTDMRRGIALARRRQRDCSDTVARMRRLRDLRYQSAWSDLPWQLSDGSLDQVLVPHDGTT